MANTKVERINNIAFIDGQNLYLGTNSEGWKVDHKKFRIYLKEKYGIETAYYFMGFLDLSDQRLFESLQKAGFIVVFKLHDKQMLSNKKGNVDSDIILEVMKNLIDNQDFNKITLVSNDGDYVKLVEYLIEKNRLLNIIFPSKQNISSLYKRISNAFNNNLNDKDIRRKIEYFKMKKAP